MRMVKWIGGSLVLILVLTGTILFGATEGWFRQPMAPPGDARAFIDEAISYLQADESANIAFALVESGQVFDTYYSAGINADTLFPVSSMSKWFTAYAVMTLVQADRIDLDAPVSTYLSRWSLPPGEFDNEQVTTRLLLSHMAGLTDGLGFGEYAADETVPGIVESLENPRTSSGQTTEVVVGQAPGSEWNYSGGGYLILELLIEEVSGQSFQEYMQEVVFEPLGMTRSTYEFLGEQENVAPSLTADGEIIPFYRYAASGATGLSTTTNDLLRFMEAHLSRAVDAPLAPGTVQQMHAPEASLLGLPIWGLGTILYAQTDGGNYVFGHGGLNEPAINAEARLNPDTGDGIVVLSTGNPSLATELGFLWTFWQTGRPDFLGFGAEVQRVIPWIGLGILAILLSAGIGFWRTRSSAR